MTFTAAISKTVRTPRATRPRIAIVDHTATLGGGEIALLNFACRIDRKKYVPLVILFSDGPLRLRLNDAGIESKIITLNPSINDTRKGTLGASVLLRIPHLLASLVFVARLSIFFRQKRIDLIHTNSLKSDILGGLAGRLAHIPVIWHVRDRIAPDYLPEAAVRVFRFLARIIPKHVIANSSATLASLRLREKEKHFTVYSGIVMPALSGVVHDGTPLQFQSAEGRTVESFAPVVGLVGRITRWKGQHVFIQAAAQVLKEFPTARFQIVGSALFGEHAYEREIHQLVKSHGISKSIEFLGFREDISEVISDLDILVHASITGEPFGQVIVEGMAAGKPVVATNGGGVPEIVVDGVTGILVPMGDVTAMGDSILRLLKDPAARKKMGMAGQQRAETHFSIDRTVREIELLYDCLHLNRPEGKVQINV